MTFPPALVDRIVAEVSRRLAEGDGGGTSPSPAADLRGHRVLTGELLEMKCEPGARVAIDAAAILTPTARDAVRQRGLTLEASSPETVAKAIGYVHQVESSPATSALVRQLGWPSRLTDTESAIEQTRSAICRGEHGFVAILTDDPHRTAARLNRQKTVWAFVPSPDAQAAAGDGWNVACLSASSGSGVAIARLLQRLASRAKGAS